MSNPDTTDVLAMAKQLALEADRAVAPDADVIDVVAKIMGSARREVLEVGSHDHGLEVEMFDRSRYVLVLEAMPDGEGRCGILFASPTKHEPAIPTFAPLPARVVRRFPVRGDHAIPAKPVSQSAIGEVAHAENELNDIARAATTTPAHDQHRHEALRQRKVAAEQRLRSAEGNAR